MDHVISMEEDLTGLVKSKDKEIKKLEQELELETRCILVLLNLINESQHKESLVKKLKENSHETFNLPEKQLNDFIQYFAEN